ncbi:MAG: hypothetical protein M3O78_01410 [Chloroflexota bacterium]|nr:hypothetical protein [Chloroflexota bacterium]
MKVPRFRAGRIGFLVGVMAFVVGASATLGSTPGGDIRLTHDNPSSSGYVSANDLAGLTHYTDATLNECSRSRGRQNEPALAIDPRDSRVMVGSSNDYCAVYNDGVDANGAPIPSGPVWLGYYRSQNSGGAFTSSLVPGYPGDTSTLGALSKAREAGAGDPVLAWDANGRLFMGAEASGDPAGSIKTFGDEWVARYVNSGGNTTLNDGKRYAGTTIVAKGSAAPSLLGVFHDKTSIEADRTDSACRGNVYFAWTRFNGNGANAIYFSRSTDHGVTFSSPVRLSSSVQSVQFPDISVTSNGHVYISFRQYAFDGEPNAVDIVKSTNCGATFSPPKVLRTIAPMGLVDVLTSGGSARDCGDAAGACQSGYTFFRAGIGTGPRSTADQADSAHEWVYLLYEAIVPGSEVATGTTFGWADASGKGGQSAIYYLRYNGATGGKTTPVRVASTSDSQQLFPDLAVDAGVIHALWYDSRNDVMNDASSFRVRPIGNDAAGNVGPGFDVFAAWRPISSGGWSSATRLSDVTSNGQYEQFSGRTVPFGGDYLWIDSKAGLTFGVWTDWRNTVAGTDQRETTVDETGADVHQCRFDTGGGVFSGDTCPRAGGLDQNIYGDLSP